jgi:hypothetical protein
LTLNARGACSIVIGLRRSSQSTNLRTSGSKLPDESYPTRAPSLLALRVTARETRSLHPASPGVHTARTTLRDTFTALHRTHFTRTASSTTQLAAMLGLSGMQPRQLAAQVLNFALVLSTAFMLWKGISIASDSPSPIVVVLSGSMEPAFQRGDLLFLWNRSPDTQVGEVVVYNVKGKDIPIVHRVVRRYGGE